MTAPQKRKEYAAPALEKGLDILELMASEGEPLTASMVATRLDRSVGEIFRMLVVLRQRGYIASSDNDRYFLTFKLFGVATRHTPIRRLTRASSHVMSLLAAEVQQSCHLVVYNAGRGVIIAQVESPADRVHMVRLGAEASLVESCSGHVFLAYAAPDERQQMLADQPEHLRQRISKSSLEAIVNGVLRRGYELIDSMQIASVRDIGYPIFDSSENTVAALVMPYLKFLDGSQKVSLSNARLAVAAAAAEISRNMGHTTDT